MALASSDSSAERLVPVPFIEPVLAGHRDGGKRARGEALPGAPAPLASPVAVTANASQLGQMPYA